MKHWFIIFLDRINDTATIVDNFINEELVEKSMEKIVINYIKECNGNSQLPKADRTEIDDQVILNEVDFNGYFYRKGKGIIDLYEKKIVTLPGWVRNTQEAQIKRVGTYSFSPYHIEDYKTCNCNVARVSTLDLNADIPFLEELRRTLEDNIDGHFGLKSNEGCVKVY